MPPFRLPLFFKGIAAKLSFKPPKFRAPSSYSKLALDFHLCATTNGHSFNLDWQFEANDSKMIIVN